MNYYESKDLDRFGEIGQFRGELAEQPDALRTVPLYLAGSSVKRSFAVASTFCLL
jgi:hypothetical protein